MTPVLCHQDQTICIFIKYILSKVGEITLPYGLSSALFHSTAIGFEAAVFYTSCRIIVFRS